MWVCGTRNGPGIDGGGERHSQGLSKSPRGPAITSASPDDAKILAARTDLKPETLSRCAGTRGRLPSCRVLPESAGTNGGSAADVVEWSGGASLRANLFL